MERRDNSADTRRSLALFWCLSAALLGAGFFLAPSGDAAQPGACRGKKECSSGSTTSATTSEPTPTATTAATTTTTASAAQPGAVASTPSSRIFPYYYLWWSEKHWMDKLGSAYPYQASPLPLPAMLGPDGCNATSLYPGAQITDSPQALWSQDDAATLERDVRAAAQAGLSGFLVAWRGTGQAGQSTESSAQNTRLEYMFQAVRKLNAEGVPFRLWIGYRASSTYASPATIRNDWTYLRDKYASDAVLDRRYSNRPVLIWIGSRKYSLDEVAAANTFRSTFFVIGDESNTTWTRERGQYLDGATWYWSSQNPYTNVHSFDQVRDLGAAVRSAGTNPDGTPKVWLSPLSPGYNSELLRGGSCVPRNGTETLERLFAGNSASNPDGWALISWNEIAEGTYVMPLQRWGSLYLQALSALVRR